MITVAESLNPAALVIGTVFMAGILIGLLVGLLIAMAHHSRKC